MKIQLAENIRVFRKKCMLTQEQLAEALGVTVGAVYKWESGRSAPEISLLVEMADLFETSVDALLGYQYRNNDRENTVKRLKAYKQNRDAEAFPDAEKALKKYPNNFEVVNCCAALYQVRGIERQDEKLLRRALELAERSCLLIDQNEDDAVSLLSIRIDMAESYLALGETDTAIQILRENNPCGINNAKIGDTLAQNCEHPEKAVPYLSKALLDCVVNQIIIVNGYLNVFYRQEDWQQSLDILEWLLQTLPLLKRPGTPSFLHKIEVVDLVCYGAVCLRLERPEEARRALRRARETALLFDANPNYSADSVRFSDLNGQYSSHDSLGATAMEAAQNIINEEGIPALTAIWKEIQNEE